MSQHQIRVSWDGNNDSESYQWTLENGTRFEASAAPALGGDASYIDPEEAFVASLSSCHLLSFIAQAAKMGFAVVSYEDEAIGLLEKNEHGRIAITQVLLQPSVKFAGENRPSLEKLQEIHEQAHRNCFIANSVNTRILIEPRAAA